MSTPAVVGWIYLGGSKDARQNASINRGHPMETENGYPTFGEEDRASFRIEDARIRADSMKELLVPKLEGLVDMALGLIRDAYEIEPLDLSNVSIRPAHRKNASKTELFESSHVGLTPKLHERRFSYLWLKILVGNNGLQTVLEVGRPHEAIKLFDVLNRHHDLAVGQLDRLGCFVWSSRGLPPDADNSEAIRSMKIDPREQWWQAGLASVTHDYPIDDEERIFESVYDFVGLFPIYQAVIEELFGTEERFPDHLRRFIAWNDATNADDEKEPESEAGASEELGKSSVDLAVTDQAIFPDIGHDGFRRRRTLAAKEVTSLRIIRDTAMAERVKRIYDYRCQVCGLRLETSEGPYAEGAHIRPLGSPHDGPDSEDNLLCLCPNHHVLFDRFGFTIAEDLSLIGIEGRLRTVEGRSPCATHLAHHRGRYNAAR